MVNQINADSGIRRRSQTFRDLVSERLVTSHGMSLFARGRSESVSVGIVASSSGAVELWLHKGQESARRITGNLIKGQKKGRGVTGSLIHEHLLKHNML